MTCLEYVIDEITLEIYTDYVHENYVSGNNEEDQQSCYTLHSTLGLSVWEKKTW